MASTDDINSTLKGVVQNLSVEAAAVQALTTTLSSGSANIVTAIQNLTATLGSSSANLVMAVNAVASAIITVFLPATGSFTLANATVTNVTQSQVQTNSVVLFTPTNATASLTQRTAGLYWSNTTAGVSFSVSTQTGVAAGTEVFRYVVITP